MSSTGKFTSNDLQVIPLSTQINVYYDPTADEYIVSGAIGGVALDAADEVSNNGYWRYYSLSATNLDHSAAIYTKANKGSSAVPAGQITLNYLSMGRWSRIENDTGRHNDSYFLFGFPTVAADVPTNGTATYRTMVTADYIDLWTSTQGTLDGTASFSVDFRNATVATTLALLNHTYSGTGAFTFNSQFAGNFTSPDDVNFTGGEFNGGFYGPRAKEMGYTFWLESFPADPYAGASLREIHHYRVIGAVVGTKN